ncbi:uncharacterized protein METZ01_LOCUS259999 [marine metagenome]|uniref:Uncharacterized protein n=1 Tax=marine metagenome TaxID=408172 RepID=A0A382J6F7_9ZZZZ
MVISNLHDEIVKKTQQVIGKLLLHIML